MGPLRSAWGSRPAINVNEFRLSDENNFGKDGTERVVGLLQLRRPEWLPTGEPKLYALHGGRVQDGADGTAGGGKGGRNAASGIAGCRGR